MPRATATAIRVRMPEAWRAYREASCGALNLGLSCFVNAAVQALVPVW